MNRRFTSLTGASAIVAAFALLPVAVASGQTQAAPTKAAAATKAVKMTPWGDPDLQGLWTGSTMTPLERPKEQAGKDHFTKEEIAAAEKEAEASRADRAPRAGDVGTYNQLWFEPALKSSSNATSLVVDPPDGRIPYTEAGKKAQEESRAAYGRGPFNSWLDLDTGERCITDGPPVYFGGYNNQYQIIQGPGYVSILHELYREPRVIRLNAEHSKIPQLMGDAIGHFEGDTLVVESTNFPDTDSKGWRWQDAWRTPRPSTKIVERFRRVDDQTIDYQFTWEDPTMFSRPWTARYPLTSNPASRGLATGGMFEYACHEDNYGLVDILSGARQKEKEKAAADTANKSSSR
jgi:hypothetical protein